VIFTREQIDQLAQTLDARVEYVGGDATLTVLGSGGTPSVVLALAGVESGQETVLSAQTVHGYFELHNVERYVVVEPDELIFVAESGDRLSGLVVGSSGACSLFANVRRSTLDADLTELEPALLLAAMQLGLAEGEA